MSRTSSAGKRRILFVGGTTGGGVATINVEVMRLFRAAGYPCDLVDTEALKARLPAPAAYLAGYLKLLALIAARRPRLVYLQVAQTGYLHQSLFLLLAKLCGRRTVAHFHAKADLAQASTPAQVRRIVASQRYIDHMIVLTEGCRRSLEANGWHGPLTVVPNFIDTRPLPRDLTPTGDRRDLLYIGRMDQEKGIFDILEAARRLPDEPFVFVGDFADPAQERRFTAELDELANVRWLGPMYDERKYAVIAGARLLVFPTRRDEFPMTLIEATILGCVPLVSDVGSVGEIVQDGVNGLSIRPGDVDGIVAAITRLRDRAELERLAAAGLAFARARFTSEAVRQTLFEVAG
ncbi:MAG: glycosyltransferase family 4 protein [Krumholzibacteria bacterium]|nr:glycosyltransferase family 4 protein [Candidatus Krumholzibacteria bacterium]